MSLILGGSLSTMVFGGLAGIAAAQSATSATVIVQPEILKLFTSLGYRFLVPRNFEKVLVDMESSREILLDEDVSSYVSKRLVDPVRVRSGIDDLTSFLGDMGLTESEARTIALALSERHDRVFLLREEAREIANSLGLKASSPLVAIVEAVKRGKLSLEEFSELWTRILRAGEGGWLEAQLRVKKR